MSAEAAISAVKPADLPAPPQAAMEIMRASSDNSVSHNELAAIVNNDPVLTAELLRVVNSPVFGISREIGSIAHAVTIIGHKALRNMVLCIAVRDALDKDAIPGFDASEFWEDALRRAVAARLLAEVQGADQDAAFTAGLLQDFGLLILFHLYPEQASSWSELRRQNPQQRMALELKTFQVTHDVVIRMLAERWQLPQDLAQILSNHHSFEQQNLAASIVQGCRILYAADWLASVYAAPDEADIIALARSEVNKVLALDENRIDECLANMSSQVEEAARALGLHVGEQPDFDEILKTANVKLAEDNLSYQELTWQLNKALADRDRYAAELNRELNAAQEVQRALLPKVTPTSIPIHAVNIPAKILSGDFYDYIQTNDGKVFFTLADVSGKGIIASLLMAKSCSIFHCLANEGHSLVDMLYILNNEICDTSSRGMFVTMIAGCYYPDKDTVVLINAGHLPALIAKPDRSILEVPSHGPPLGIMPEVEYKPVKFTLGQNVLYTFTDGITECRLDAQSEMLELEGIKKMISEYADLPTQQRLQTIVEQVTGDEVVAKDDITMLVLGNHYVR